MNSNYEAQFHMTWKPVLRGEVGARAWRVCGQTREEVWASAGGARRLVKSACVVKPSRRVVVVVRAAVFFVVLPAGVGKAPCDSNFVGSSS